MLDFLNTSAEFQIKKTVCGLMLLLLYVNDLLDDSICKTAIYADDTAL